MKVLKMRIKRETIDGGTHYVYPSAYDASKVVFGPFYESALAANLAAVQARGLGDEYVIIGVANTDEAAFLQADSETDGTGFTFSTIELLQIDAGALGNTWTEQVDVVTDANRVLEILAKQALGATLTQDELNALDPTNPEPGINRAPLFSDELATAMGAF